MDEIDISKDPAAEPPAETVALSETAGPGRGARIVLAVLGLLFATGLIIYSQLRAFAWDEGFHLLAAQLIQGGKKPYIDFCFPQTPLNAYWNAALLRIFGDTWHAPHVAAALFTAAAVWMLADYILSRFPVRRWRFAAALVAGFLAAMNPAVFQFGPVQAYGICLFLLVAAFRVAVLAVAHKGVLLTAMAGLLISAAAACSLLTAPAILAMMLWLLIFNRQGNRWKKLLAFVAAGAIPFIPVIVLFLQAPYQVYFNLFGYHLFFRRVKWDGATGHDLETVTSWITSPSTLFLGLLAIAGLLFARKRNGWERPWRGEYYLAGLMAVLMALEIGSAHPTFAWYFLVAVPFAGIAAAAGYYSVFGRLYGMEGPRFFATASLIILLVFATVRIVILDNNSLTWLDMDAIAKKVNAVTPASGKIWADEHIYFILHRPPPEGMQFAAAHKLELGRALEAKLHIISEKELDAQIKAGVFDTVATCDDDDHIKSLGLPDLYSQKADVSTCNVFWDKKKRQP